MVHRENTTDDNQETLLLDIVLIQGYSCSARADFNLNKRKKRTPLFLSLPQVHKYGERIAPLNPTLLPLLDFEM